MAAALLFAAVGLTAGEGFGWVKTTANLTRTKPPQVFIGGTKLSIRASSQDHNGSSAAQRLKSQLESQLIGHDRRFSIEESKPETVIELKVLKDEYGERWESREGQEQYDTGNRDAKGHRIYATRNVTLQYKIVRHSFSTAYKVFEPQTGRSLFADTLNRNVQNEFLNGNGAPDASTLESGAIDSITATVTTQLTPTKEVVGVLIPKGSFEAAGAFATAGLWSKYLDALEKLQPRPNAADEAYRQYGLGVAYEAMGYGAEDPETTLKYLEQASTHYNNAIDSNPKEGYFRQGYESVLNPLSKKSARAPLDRVQEALAQYQKVKEFEEAKKAGGGGSIDAAGAKALPGAITNAQIIEMLQAGLAEDVIITSINSAPATAFDVSPKALIQLSQAKATKNLIQKIQAAANGTKSPAEGTKKTAPKSAKKKSS
ncbi:MAG TPA: hypothetical protein VJZ76_24775 [Thermoanaerobaculia bacterium]|nr:hypothetical protein [Thermoanaerobaculia bacterium]